jgi:hypothetical protein
MNPSGAAAQNAKQIGERMKAMDEESLARIQDFVSWAAKKGYHVVGALIDKEHPFVRSFATGPEGPLEKQEEHVKKLVKILYMSVTNSKLSSCQSLPLGEV